MLCVIPMMATVSAAKDALAAAPVSAAKDASSFTPVVLTGQAMQMGSIPPSAFTARATDNEHAPRAADGKHAARARDESVGPANSRSCAATKSRLSPGEQAKMQALRRMVESVGQASREDRRYVATGLEPLDRALPHGGFPCGAITEILADGAGVGATTLALRLASAGANAPQLPEHRLLAGATLDSRLRGNDGESRGSDDGSRGNDDGSRGNDGESGDAGTTPASLPHPDVPRFHRDIPPHGGVHRDGSVQPLADARGSVQPLADAHGSVQSLADAGSSIVMVDAKGLLYPPALHAQGIALHRVVVVRPRDATQAMWAIEQSLRCPGVAVVVAWLRELDGPASRRLQLAAESTGSMGIVLLPDRPAKSTFSAVRLRVEPADLDEHIARSRWDRFVCRITLLKVRHGRLDVSLLTDLHHETGTLPVLSASGHRSATGIG